MERIKTENLTAEFEVSYTGADENLKTEKFSRQFEVTYPVVEKGIQPLVAIVLLILSIGGFVYLFAAKRREKYLVYFMQEYLSDHWQKSHKNSHEALVSYLENESDQYR